MDKRHFWLSSKYDKMREIWADNIPSKNTYNYALLDDGRVVRYNFCADVSDLTAAGYDWKDAQYLGEGVWYHTSSVPLDDAAVTALQVVASLSRIVATAAPKAPQSPE